MSMSILPATLRADSQARPIVFDGHVGRLHLPADQRHRATGILICLPPGRDGRCTFRPLKTLAETLCDLGFPVLRFELLGQGDSRDLPADANAWEAWQTGIASAVETLKREGRVERVAGLGFRLSASLLATAPVGFDALALLAPVVSGRGYVRELKLAAAMSQTLGPEGDEGLESDGLQINRASLAHLVALDLAKIDRAPPNVLVAASKPIASGVIDHLGTLTTQLWLQDFPGYEALLEDTHSNQAPDVLFQRLADWFSAVTGEVTAPVEQSIDLCPKPVALDLDNATEHHLQFGPGLSGILAEPRKPGAGQRAVVFCNTSKEPKSGVGRFAAIAARRLADAGIASLRFDFTGVGESEGDNGHVYDTARRTDFIAAADLLESLGYPNACLVGVCSGAFHTLATLRDETRFDAAFVVSAKLVWRTSDSLTPEMRDQGRATGAYVQGLRDPKTLLRLLKGEVDVRAVVKTLTRRLKARAAARLDNRDGRPFVTGINRLSARGGRLHMLVGLDDSSLDEVETYFGRGGQRLTALPGMSLSIEPSLDHGLAKAKSRDVAIDQLLRFLAD